MVLFSLRNVALSAAISLASVLPGFAQDMLPRNAQAVHDVARAFGNIQFSEPDRDGRPVLEGDVDGVLYSIVLYGCDNPQGCESVQFYSSYISDNNTLEFVNQWNRDKRYVTAYIAEDGDAVIAFTVNIEFGVSRQNFIDTFDAWVTLMDQFNERIYSTGAEADPSPAAPQPSRPTK